MPVHDWRRNSSIPPRNVPIIADADTGYGGPIIVARTVKSYISAGIAGMHLEDQVLAKRCGHPIGKELVSWEEYYTRIKAAMMAKRRRTSNHRGRCGFDSQNGCFAKPWI